MTPKNGYPNICELWHHDGEHPGPPAAMLRTCRQIHDETLDMLYQNNTLELQLVSYPPIDCEFYESDEHSSNLNDPTIEA
jgi:hypothetical protein